MVSATLIEKLEQLSPELQKRIEASVDGLLKHRKVQAGLLPAPPRFEGKMKPGFGGAKGFFGEMSDDFDAPIDGMKDYM